MIILKNNYFWLEENGVTSVGFMANGDTIKIVRVRAFEDRGAFRFCRAVVKMVDYPELPELDVILLCNSIWEETPSLSWEKMKELAALVALDYPDIKNIGQLRRQVQKDPYYNALQVKFAYAITCHKSQGGQWSCVFVDHGYLTDDMAGKELNRWFYTALTRTKGKLFLVGFHEKMLAEATKGG